VSLGNGNYTAEVRKVVDTIFSVVSDSLEQNSSLYQNS
jgi:hypothetical protein